MTEPHVITVSGEVDHSIVQGLREHLLAEVDAAQADLVVVDLTGVTLMDSTGLGMLVTLYKRQHARGARTALTGASMSLVELLHVTGLDAVLPLLEAGPPPARA
jgi:anti-anti-sigma factor